MEGLREMLYWPIAVHKRGGLFWCDQLLARLAWQYSFISSLQADWHCEDFKHITLYYQAFEKSRRQQRASIIMITLLLRIDSFLRKANDFLEIYEDKAIVTNKSNLALALCILFEGLHDSDSTWYRSSREKPAVCHKLGI